MEYVKNRIKSNSKRKIVIICNALMEIQQNRILTISTKTRTQTIDIDILSRFNVFVEKNIHARTVIPMLYDSHNVWIDIYWSIICQVGRIKILYLHYSLPSVPIPIYNSVVSTFFAEHRNGGSRALANSRT